jgi:hypothetical protein
VQTDPAYPRSTVTDLLLSIYDARSGGTAVGRAPGSRDGCSVGVSVPTRP